LCNIWPKGTLLEVSDAQKNKLYFDNKIPKLAFTLTYKALTT